MNGWLDPILFGIRSVLKKLNQFELLIRWNVLSFQDEIVRKSEKNGEDDSWCCEDEAQLVRLMAKSKKRMNHRKVTLHC